MQYFSKVARGETFRLDPSVNFPGFGNRLPCPSPPSPSIVDPVGENGPLARDAEDVSLKEVIAPLPRDRIAVFDDGLSSRFGIHGYREQCGADALPLFWNVNRRSLVVTIAVL